MPVIQIPTPLRKFTADKASVDVIGQTVGDALGDLTVQHEGLRDHLFNEDGSLRNFVNVYKGDDDVRYLKGTKTPPRRNRRDRHHPRHRRRPVR